MVDWNGLMLGPHYTPGLGASVLVLLEIDSASYVDLPAMDMARGQVVNSQESPSIEDMNPGVRFRASDLVARGIDVDALRGAHVTMNGIAWRIESSVPLASPDGEGAGEIGCNLAQLEVPT